MTETRTMEEINAEYRRKIPVFGEDIDKADSEDYLLYKVTHVPLKVLIIANEL